MICLLHPGGYRFILHTFITSWLNLHQSVQLEIFKVDKVMVMFITRFALHVWQHVMINTCEMLSILNLVNWEGKFNKTSLTYHFLLKCLYISLHHDHRSSGPRALSNFVRTSKFFSFYLDYRYYMYINTFFVYNKFKNMIRTSKFHSNFLFFFIIVIF